MMKMKKMLFWMGLVLLTQSLLVHAEDSTSNPLPQPKHGLFLNDVRMIPIQSGGRLKPFDEFAREAILLLTGSRSFGNFDPSEMVISMMVEPQKWLEVPIIRISNEDVRKQLLVDPTQKFFSPHELLKNNTFLQYAEGITNSGSLEQVTSTGVNAVTTAKNARTEELKRVVERVSYFQALIQGRLWAITPPAHPQADTAEGTAWGTLIDGMTNPTPQSQAVYELLKSYMEGNVDLFKEKAVNARKVIEDAVPQFEQAKSKLTAEVFYNTLRPFLQAMIFYLCAGLLWLLSGLHFLPRQMAKFLTFAGVAMHLVGFSLRCYVAGRPPVTNMYESIIWVSLGVMVFATILFVKFKQTVLMSTATILSGLALFAADSAPMLMDPTIRPLVPVLRSNYWLTIHVLTITASYAAYMLAMGISNTTLFMFYKKSRVEAVGGDTLTLSQRIATLNQLAYRAMQFGVVLLAAGTILGGVWADYSWGRFWGWDPKEVWALIALLVYIAILHGRFAGWVGTFAFPMWTVICFSTVIMAWYGVNFVLGVGLHSYGFSNGGQASVAGFVIFQSLYCLWIWFEHRKGKNAAPKNPSTLAST